MRVDLANLDGSWAQDIQVLNENNGLSPNYHYTDGNNFMGTITVEPGTYLMEVAYQAQGSSDWYYAGSSKFSNPVYVIVEAPVIVADIYEDNNAQSKAYKLPVNFSGSSATSNTNGSSLHLGTDIDYYKIELPSGYNYTITPRLHDSFDSGNRQSYSVDALFSYSTNGITYSETYDAAMPGNISIYKGGTVYFKVAPYFSGSTGTYLLNMSITRNTAATGIDDIETAQISLYPNPANDFVMIDAALFEGKISQIVFYDVQGRQIKSIDNPDKILKISLDDVCSGVYVVKVFSDKGVFSKKIMVRK